MKRTFLIFGLILVSAFSFGLTPAERTVVQRAQIQLRQGKADYAAAKNALAAADQKAADAQAHATATDAANAQLTKDVKTFSDKADSIAKERDKMKPVYDQCTAKWGIGAIIFGIK